MLNSVFKSTGRHTFHCSIYWAGLHKACIYLLVYVPPSRHTHHYTELSGGSSGPQNLGLLHSQAIGTFRGIFSYVKWGRCKAERCYVHGYFWICTATGCRTI